MKKYKKQPQTAEAVEVREEFTVYGMKHLDSKDRISLGGKLKKILGKIDGFQVFVGNDGDILLRPAVTVPAREAWVYKNPEAIGPLRKSMEDVKAGRTVKVKSVKGFLKNL